MSVSLSLWSSKFQKTVNKESRKTLEIMPIMKEQGGGNRNGRIFPKAAHLF